MTQHVADKRNIAGIKEGNIEIELRGSRLMNLTPGDSGHNALWINPDPGRNSEAELWNLGGDRLWISPELDFLTNPAGQSEVPERLDPGSWQWQEPEDQAATTMATRMTTKLYHFPSNREVTVDIIRNFKAVANPLFHNPNPKTDQWLGIPYIGCEVETFMQLEPTDLPSSLEGTHAAYCNLWSITQVPPGGQVLIPVWNGDNDRPVIMYGQQDPISLTPHTRGWQLHFTGDKSYKLSFNGIQSCGRFGYLRRLDEQHFGLLIRQFTVNPSAVYPDYPLHDKQMRGSCMQFFYDGGHMGGFGELEYHVPALSINEGGSVQDRSQLYYYVGPEQELRQIAGYALGIQS